MSSALISIESYKLYTLLYTEVCAGLCTVRVSLIYSNCAWKCKRCIFLFLNFSCNIPLFAYHSHMFVTMCLLNVERKTDHTLGGYPSKLI